MCSNNPGSDMKSARKSVETVTFTFTGQSYTRRLIESIQLLHYKSLDGAQILGRAAIQRASLIPSRPFELVVFYDDRESAEMGEDVDRTIIHGTVEKNFNRCEA